MGKATKQKRRVAASTPEHAPNPFAMQHGEYHRPTLAYRRTPAIDSLRDAKDGSGKPKLSARQYAALAHYRDRYIACERSPIKDSCDQDMRGGNGDGFPFHRTAASIDLQFLEERLGRCHPRLIAIARYVAGQDHSLTQWAVHRHGPREGTINEAKTVALKYALIDIRMAGDCLAEGA